MASGWNLWVWLVGVVVRRYIDILIIIINFPYSTCISSFLAAASLLLCSYLKCFFVLLYINDISDSVPLIQYHLVTAAFISPPNLHTFDQLKLPHHLFYLLPPLINILCKHT